MAKKLSSKAISFAAAAGAAGATALLATVCPAPCFSCTGCVTALMPMSAAVGAVGAGIVGSAVAKSRSAKKDAVAVASPEAGSRYATAPDATDGTESPSSL